jgi:hypothetical protein
MNVKSAISSKGWDATRRKAQAKYAQKRFERLGKKKVVQMAVKAGKESARRRCGLSPVTIGYLDGEMQRILLEECNHESILGGVAVVMHHYIGKSNLAVRWHRDNLIPLTHKQHMDLHSHPELCVAYDTMIKKIKGDDWLIGLHAMSSKHISWLDKDLIEKYLNNEVDTYL